MPLFPPFILNHQLNKNYNKMSRVENINHRAIKSLKESYPAFYKNKKRRGRVRYLITEIIKLGVNCLREGQFKTLIEQWKDTLSDCIEFCLKNWEMYSYQLQEPLMRFTRMLEVKIKQSSMKESESNEKLLFQSKFKPMVQKLLNFFSADSLDVLFEKGVLNQSVRLAKIFLKLEVCNEPQHENSVQDKNQWSNIQINRAKGQRPPLNNSSFNYTQASLNLSQAAQTIYSDYLATIGQQRVMETRCLGCSTFFLQNFNILDRTINRVPLEMFPSVWSMKEYENQIKNTICYLMNIKGGVILFDCLASSGVVLANGTKLTEQNKQMFKHRLQSYLEVFEPSEEVKRSVTVTYVPVVYSSEGEKDLAKKDRSFYLGEESFIKPGQSYISRDFIPGHFVMRVRVCPKSNTSVCFWRQSNNSVLEQKYKDYVCTLNRNGVKTTIKPSEIGKEIKKRMKEHYLPENLTSKQLRQLSHPSNCFSHECKQPEPKSGSIQKPCQIKQVINERDHHVEQRDEQIINNTQEYINLSASSIQQTREQNDSNNQDNVLITVKREDTAKRQNSSERIIQDIIFVVQKVKNYEILDCLSIYDQYSKGTFILSQIIFKSLRNNYNSHQSASPFSLKSTHSTKSIRKIQYQIYFFSC